MQQLRADPPTAVGHVGIDRIDDLLNGVDGFPPSDILRLWLADGSRVIVRPSGTEPKLKVYIDVRGTTAADATTTLRALEDGVRELIS